MVVVAVLINAALTAAETGLAVHAPSPVSIGGSVFCFLMFIWSLAMFMRRD